jgi:hypothetical protein
MPRARTACAVVSAMWTNGTSITSMIASATLCIVFVQLGRLVPRPVSASTGSCSYIGSVQPQPSRVRRDHRLISRLRAKLGDPPVIETVARAGYRI